MLYLYNVTGNLMLLCYFCFRLLGINATRRGVKTCPLCMKKIGYRSKQCKFCSPSKQRKRSRKSQQSKESRKDDGRDHSNIQMDIVVMASETEVATSEISNTAEVASKQVVEDSEPAATAVTYDQETQQNITAVEAMDPETAQQNGSEQVMGKKNYHTSLQDLIHTLLVQNQNNSVYIAPDHQVEADKLGTELQNSNQQEDDDDEEVEQEQEHTEVSAGTVGSPENTYDANSVALFLGHLAQQNGKKIRTALNPVIDNTQPGMMSVSSLIGVKTKHVVIEDDMSSQAKYRKIRPKSIDEGPAVLEIQPSVASTVEEDLVDNVVEMKPTESQLRYGLSRANSQGPVVQRVDNTVHWKIIWAGCSKCG